MERPEVRYTKSGDINIAYSTVGEGPFDIVFVAGWVLSVFESAWDGPAADTSGGSRRSARLILFDKRGTGLSDRVYAACPTSRRRMDDIRAVMDAVGSKRAAIARSLRGRADDAALRGHLSGAHGRAPILYATTLTFRRRRTPGSPTAEEWKAMIEERPRRHFGSERVVRRDVRGLSPSIADDEEMQRWWRRWVLASTSPGALDGAAAHEQRSSTPGTCCPRSACPRSSCIRRRRQTGTSWRGGTSRSAIPGARVRRAAGTRSGWWVRPDQIGDEAERVPRRDLGARRVGRRRARPRARDRPVHRHRRLDGEAAELGDRRWRELLSKHHARVRRQLARFRGRELDTAGDGFFASFDGPARAIRCACAIVEAVRDLGLGGPRRAAHGRVRADGRKGRRHRRAHRRAGGRPRPSRARCSSRRTVKDLVAGLRDRRSRSAASPS